MQVQFEYTRNIWASDEAFAREITHPVRLKNLFGYLEAENHFHSV